jgi:hypothetical protein
VFSVPAARYHPRLPHHPLRTRESRLGVTRPSRKPLLYLASSLSPYDAAGRGSFSLANRLGFIVCRASDPTLFIFFPLERILWPRVRQLGLWNRRTIQLLIDGRVSLSPVPWSHTSCVCADRSEMMGCNEIKVRRAQASRSMCNAYPPSGGPKGSRRRQADVMAPGCRGQDKAFRGITETRSRSSRRSR